MHSGSKTKSGFDGLDGESGERDMRMPRTWIRMVHAFRPVRRRERVHHWQAQLFGDFGTNLHQPSWILRLHLSAGIPLQPSRKPLYTWI